MNRINFVFIPDTLSYYPLISKAHVRPQELNYRLSRFGFFSFKNLIYNLKKENKGKSNKYDNKWLNMTPGNIGTDK